MSDKALQLATIVFCLAVVPCGRSEAVEITFTKIADQTTTIPGGGGTFTRFVDISHHAGRVAFHGVGTDREGIYLFEDGSLSRIVDTNTGIPDGVGTFTGFSPVSLRGTSVAFAASGSDQGGIYTNVGGQLRTVANRNTVIPHGTGSFTHMDQPSFDGTNVAFVGFGSGGHFGMYMEGSGSLSVIGDTNTLVPDGVGTLTGISSTPASLSNGEVAFHGRGSGQSGIYVSDNGSLNTIVNLDTEIPGGFGRFTAFDVPALDRGTVAFRGEGIASQNGLFTNAFGALESLVDTNTEIPEGLGNFNALGHPALDRGIVAFEGFGNEQRGIYSNFSGKLINVIDLFDTLDGKTFHPSAMSGFSLSTDSLSEHAIAFRARFADGSTGLYLASMSIISDLTGNGWVDFDDLTILLANWDMNGPRNHGNVVEPDTTAIDFDDLSFLLSEWTGPDPFSPPSPLTPQGARQIPEPSTFVLFVCGVMCLVFWSGRIETGIVGDRRK